MFLILIELLNIDIVYIINLILNLILKLCSLILPFIFNFLKSLIKRSSLIKSLKKKFLNLAYKQREILLLYYWKNDVYSYIVGNKKSAFADPDDISNNLKVIYTLVYIIDNFLNTTEQYIERFVLIFRQIFIKLVFSIPNRIYYKIFPRNFSFSAVLKPKRFRLYVFRYLIFYYTHIIVYWINLMHFYTIVYFENLSMSLYESRKTIYKILILYIFLNLVFKESFSIIYEFFLSFFDYNFLISNAIRDFSFKRSMHDIFGEKTKYAYFFKSEYKQFYSSGQLYKLYYVYLTVKIEFMKNIENYWKFFKMFPPWTVFIFHNYYLFKRKINRYKVKRKKKYGETKRDRYSRRKKEDRYRKKAVYERDFQKRSNDVLERFWKKYLTIFDDKIQGVYYYIWDVIQFFIKDRTHYLNIKRTSYRKRKITSPGIFFKFLFRILFKFFWLLKKLIMIAMKKTLFKIFFILLAIIAVLYIIFYLWPKRKKNIKIVFRDYVLFDCTLEEFICNFVLNLIIVVVFFYIISFIPPILHFYLFKVYKPFLVYLYKEIKKYFGI